MPEPRHLQIARRYLGTREIPGSRHSATVLGFFAKAGFSGIKRDEVPWCAAFANAVMDEAGLPETNSLLARSFLDWGIEIDEPRIGAIVVFRRGNSTWQGHVGFVVGWTATHIRVLGGNQSNAVTIANYPRSKLLGFRWPKGVTEPARGSVTVLGGEPATVKASVLNMRDAPKSTGGNIQTQLSHGTAIEILDTWHHVRAGSREGWVSGRYIETTN